MLWHAMPPEANTAMLMAGAGPAPMMQAAAGYQAWATALETQALELATLLVSLQAAWTGASSERGIAAITPMVSWLQTAAQHAQLRAAKATAQAASYMKALGTTPSLPEIATNHITHGVLTATNFLGINMVPIGFNETDYFVRMWNQAGGAMDIYQAETLANTTFEPIEPVKPIVTPGMGEAAEATALGEVSAMGAKAAALRTLSEIGDDIPAPKPTPDIVPIDQQLMQFLSQMGQMSGPMQQLMQPMQQMMQQMTSLASQTGGTGADSLVSDVGALGDKEPGPIGLFGASPFSPHTAAGGLGPNAGMGMMHAESLPGAGGTSPRTALMSNLIDKPGVAPAGTGAGSSAAGGAAPVGGMGAGAGAQSGAGARPGLATPVLLARSQDDNAHEDLDDMDDGDDW